MTKNKFLEELETALKQNHVPDREEILLEYEEHFAFKLADGFSEEEIAGKLGDPKSLSAQFEPASPAGKTGRNTLTALGLGFVDFLFGLFCILLFVWEIVMAALALCFGTGSVCLLGGLNLYALLPPMPYGCAVIFGVLFAALAVLSLPSSGS